MAEQEAYNYLTIKGGMDHTRSFPDSVGKKPAITSLYYPL